MYCNHIDLIEEVWFSTGLHCTLPTQAAITPRTIGLLDWSDGESTRTCSDQSDASIVVTTDIGSAKSTPATEPVLSLVLSAKPPLRFRNNVLNLTLVLCKFLVMHLVQKTVSPSQREAWTELTCSWLDSTSDDFWKGRQKVESQLIFGRGLGHHFFSYLHMEQDLFEGKALPTQRVCGRQSCKLISSHTKLQFEIAHLVCLWLM